MGWAQQQKEKGTRLSLTWFEARKCWKKKVDGRPIYFKFPNSGKGYEQALEAWAAWKKEHEKPLDPDKQRHRLEGMADWYRVHGEPEGEEGTLAEIEAALSSNQRVPTTQELKHNFPAWPDPPFKSARIELNQVEKWNERLREHSRPTRRKITDYVALFLDSKLAQVKGSVRKPKTYGDLVDRLKAFKQFVGTATLDALDETLVRRYYNHLISLDKLSGLRKRNLFRAFQMLTRWLESEGYLDKAPRNLKSSWEFVEHLKNGQRQNLADKLYTKDDVKLILAKLSPRGQACVLLGLNCGFTEADIAALRKSEVDLFGGRIIYSRTKTVRVRTAPVVNYKLWKVTVDALQAAESEQSADLWFTTDSGSPLKTSKVVENRHVEWSLVAQRWKVWQKSGKVPKKPFKMFRKTGATIIGDSKYRPWVELYLADVPTSIAGKHYDLKSGKVIPELDKAIVYLGQQVGLS